MQPLAITMPDYLQIKFSNLPVEKQDLLIALLSDAGYEGFEEGPTFLSAYISQENFNDAVLDNIETQQEVVAAVEVIPEKNWNAEWEKNFEPVVIGNFCAVRASFHEPIGGVEHEIVITPKMSFGTGHHATTYIMIETMKQLPIKGKRVLDFGTGTGILAILAEKCGAAEVMAIDNDEWSIENAAENIAVNKCTAITLKKADQLQDLDEYDVILANINRHVILANMLDLKQHLRLNGVLVLSGLLPDDAPVIEEKAAANDLRIIEQKFYNNWIGLLFT
jgi:ribosomal protein L11 methyltransferase